MCVWLYICMWKYVDMYVLIHMFINMYIHTLRMKACAFFRKSLLISLDYAFYLHNFFNVKKLHFKRVLFFPQSVATYWFTAGIVFEQFGSFALNLSSLQHDTSSPHRMHEKKRMYGTILSLAKWEDQRKLLSKRIVILHKPAFLLNSVPEQLRLEECVCMWLRVIGTQLEILTGKQWTLVGGSLVPLFLFLSLLPASRPFLFPVLLIPCPSALE